MHGSQASRREYDRLIGEYVANGRQAFTDPEDILIKDLTARYRTYRDTSTQFSKSTRNKVLYVLRLLKGFGPFHHGTL
jgi:hypothetical protein